MQAHEPDDLDQPPLAPIKRIVVACDGTFHIDPDFYRAYCMRRVASGY